MAFTTGVGAGVDFGSDNVIISSTKCIRLEAGAEAAALLASATLAELPSTSKRTNVARAAIVSCTASSKWAS